MKHILGATKRTITGSVAALFLLTAVAVAIPPQTASAAGLLRRSLTLSSSQASDVTPVGAGGEVADPGEGGNGQKVSHTYGFEVKSATAIQAFKFQYCNGPFGYLAFDNGTGTCTTNAGFAAPTAVNAGATVSSWDSHADYLLAPGTPNGVFNATALTIVPGTSQEFVVNTAAPATPLANEYLVISFPATATSFFVNPTTAAPDTFFAHIETYASTAAAATETEVDEGTVASSTSETIDINTRVAESLKFSVTADNTPEAEGTECDALTGLGRIDMGNPANEYALSASQTYDAYSYFRLATNSARGAKVLYSGDTLKSTAGDSIAALTTKTASALNTPQFGLALSGDSTGSGDAELANDVADDDTGPNDLAATTEYNAGVEGFTTNNANGSYAFVPTSNTVPVSLATSTGVVSCDTGVVRYIANISNDTPAGIYSTRISYIAAPAF